MRPARRIKAGLDPLPGYVEVVLVVVVVVVVVVELAAGAVEPALSVLAPLEAGAADAGADASLFAPPDDFEPLFLKSVTYQPEPFS